MLTHSCQDELLAYAAGPVSALYSNIDIEQGRHLVWSCQAHTLSWLHRGTKHGRTDGPMLVADNNAVRCMQMRHEDNGFCGLADKHSVKAL